MTAILFALLALLVINGVVGLWCLLTKNRPEPGEARRIVFRCRWHARRFGGLALGARIHVPIRVLVGEQYFDLWTLTLNFGLCSVTVDLRTGKGSNENV